MTFCTQCGTENDINSRYCRDCGKRLEVPETQDPEPVVASPTTSSEIGDLIYEGFRLYESGDLDGAAARCREILTVTPRSSSAHTLLSMIYEKHGDTEEANDNPEGAKIHYLEAIAEREKVLKFNPGSVVDAEKLKELKKKVAAEPGRIQGLNVLVEHAKNYLMKIPVPVMLSVGSGAIVFLIVLAIMGGGNSKKKPANSNVIVSSAPQSRGPAQNGTGRQYMPNYPQQGMTQGIEGEENPSSEDDTMIFTSPDEPQETQRRQNPPSVSSSAGDMPSQSVPRMNPPSVKSPQRGLDPLPTIEVVPINPPKGGGSQTQAGANPQAKPPQHKEPEINIQIEKSGEDYQREAMRLYSEGKKGEATDAFRSAIDVYNEQLKKGSNAESANAGIRTCKMYLQILQQ